jgi:glycosyltransferase involved in cell wall biosynthesis
LLTYNRASLLPRTIESLLVQTHGDFELIINDDRSTDDTEAVCREFERRDSRVRYYRNRVNLRYAQNQNAAIVRAKSELVAIVHDGDVYRADLIERWTRAMQEYPTAALVFNAYDVMNEHGEVVITYHSPFKPLVPGLDLFDYIINRSSSPIWGIVMVRKGCVMEVGPFDPRLPTLADVDMWLRLLLRFDAAYIDEALLRVAPREAGHFNSGANWRVRTEHELIYAINAVRRFPNDRAALLRLRSRIERTFWKLRIQTLLFSARHADARGLWSGLRAIARQPLATLSPPTTGEFSWASVRESL